MSKKGLEAAQAALAKVRKATIDEKNGMRSPEEDTLPIREASADDHPYGAWSGGSKASGGHAGGGGITDEEAESLAKQAKEAGFTVKPFGGDAPSEGFTLSIFPEREKKIPVNGFSASSVSEYAAANKALIAKPGNYLGGWREGNDIYLDVSTNVKTLKQAEELGRKHGQLAGWDVVEKREVRFDESSRGRATRKAILGNPEDAEAVEAFVKYLKG